MLSIVVHVRNRSLKSPPKNYNHCSVDMAGVPEAMDLWDSRDLVGRELGAKDAYGRKRQENAVYEPEKIYKQLLPISEMKKRDLEKLCKNNVIPADASGKHEAKGEKTALKSYVGGVGNLKYTPIENAIQPFLTVKSERNSIA
ncbi:unnamed protein product [Acanthoscelides obtectus]|uniref:Uncharacterized protein n=1 Tax=Acanthoscelides obtectus TaxID=200917 RepID=A0A9P0LNK6_ACAOB|nr:unnamed protein product [Acanthoscelides obtectus]CAK1635404.1 hypothetical protein AOBTE_LOCUS9258 [Acanthoscelides obtectus]